MCRLPSFKSECTKALKGVRLKECTVLEKLRPAIFSKIKMMTSLRLRSKGNLCKIYDVTKTVLFCFVLFSV